MLDSIKDTYTVLFRRNYSMVSINVEENRNIKYSIVYVRKKLRIQRVGPFFKILHDESGEPIKSSSSFIYDTSQNIFFDTHEQILLFLHTYIHTYVSIYLYIIMNSLLSFS